MKDFINYYTKNVGIKNLIDILEDFEDHTNWFINLFLKNYSFKESIKVTSFYYRSDGTKERKPGCC